MERYKFPKGKWSVGNHRAASGDPNEFTGKYYLDVTGTPDNPYHSKAIVVCCDDEEFISELLAFLNRGNTDDKESRNSV